MPTSHVARHRRARQAPTRARRYVAVLTVASLGLLGSVVVQRAATAAAPAPAITLGTSAPSSVLAGDQVTFTLTASNPAANPGAAPEYNVSLRDVLPVGVTYAAGTTSPSDIGEPTVVTAGNGRQTLIWRDVFDLQIAASSSLTFTANIDNSPATGLPVGSTVVNAADAYASTAPRYVPRFDATGAPVADGNVQSAAGDVTSTNVSALKIAKTEPSPEHKLLRGVHDRTTTYTVTVTNTSLNPTKATSVSDYLPAQLEFLGCGGVDNSAGVEYPGAASLKATPEVDKACPTPTSVGTVADPPADGSVTYPPGVYTAVTWNLGTLAAGQTVTIRYAVGVPLRENVLFDGGPSPASLGQVANLDNNTGASTRQDGDADTQRNYVHAAGVYQGPVKAGTGADVVADGSVAVAVQDLRVYKSVSPGEFVAGAPVTYTLHVDSGEYTDNSAITITDVLPNGVCPLEDNTNYVSGAPAECDPDDQYRPSLPYESVTQHDDGTFTVVFTPIAVAKDGSTVITYEARNRTVYTGGKLEGSAPAAGDSFTNSASEEGTSTAVPSTGAKGDLTVRDSTSATQTTSFGTMQKLVGARAVPADCAKADYGDTNPVFVEGDRACFQITVPFSTTNQTRSAVVTDFLPENTTFEAGSESYPSANTVDPSQLDFDPAGGALTWTLGAKQPDGTREVPVGSVFVVRFSVIVTGSAPGPAPDKPGNIVKLRTTNSAGAARSLRDGVDFRIAAAPPVGITKGVVSVDDPTGKSAVKGAAIDNATVREGSDVLFRVNVTNNGSTANGNDLPITDIELWDVLPTGIDCAQIRAISDSGTCTDNAQNGRSRIVWPGDPDADNAVAAGQGAAVSYIMTIPAGTSVSTNFVNTAGVRSYDAPTDLGGTATHYPAANIDPSVPVADYDAPPATDDSNVRVPDVGVTKGVTSAINESGNTGAEASPSASTRATIGEQVTYTVAATVPAHTTVYRATFTDPLPAGLTLNSATATYRPDAASGTTAALPGGVTFSGSAPPAFTFPTTYDNTTGTDQVFAMTIVATVADVSGNQAGGAKTNTASFASWPAATGGTALPARTATATVYLVAPAPALAKTSDAAAGGVSGGDTVTYTVTPSNPAGRAPLHDAWVLDCLPTGLTFGSYGTVPSGVTASSPVAGDGSNGCASGNTVLAWRLGDLAAGQSPALTYTATVDTTSAGKSTRTNVATVSGNSLTQARPSATDPGNPAGRQYTVTASSVVNISGATATKSVSPTSAVPGQTVTYRTSATLPTGVNFYNLSLIDTLPAGIDPKSVALVSTQCTNADTSACALSSATALSKNAAGTSTVIGWLLGDSGAGTQVRTVTVTYTARVGDVPAAVAGATLTNQLTVSWDTAPKSQPTSSTASFAQSSPIVTATVTVLEPGLALAKSVTRSHPEPGQTFTYSLTVVNPPTATAARAYNVTVTDAVPTGVVVTSLPGNATIAGNDPVTGGGTITWMLPLSVAVGATPVVLSYDATLAPSGTLTTAGLANSATISGYDSLGSGGRHYSGRTATVTVGPYFPAMTTTKAITNRSPAYLGEPYGWQVTATNSGSGTAYGAGVVDTLPRNWTYGAGTARVTVNGGPATPVEPTVLTAGGVQTLTWTQLGDLPAGTALRVTYAATPSNAVVTAPGVGTSVDQTNTASSNAKDATGAPGNKSGDYGSGPATAVARISSADLSLAKVVGTAPTAGRSGSWVITATNNGPDTATGPFTVTDDVAGTGVSNVQAIGTGWTCSGAPSLTCTRTGTLAKDASLPPITVTYDVGSTVPAGTSLGNTASVTAHTYDPTPANNSASASTTVATAADVTIQKTLSSAELVAGRPVSYRLAVDNLGPSSAAGPITVTDTIPAGTTFVDASGAGWSCQPVVAGKLTCTLAGPLTVGATPDALIVTVQVASSRTAAVVNTATVGSPTPDPVTSDNTSTVTTTPVVRADVAISKTHVTDVFVAGDPVDYRIEVTNNGPSHAAGVQVTDTLPAGMTYRSVASDDPNWTCSAAGQQVTCNYGGTLAPGTTALTLTVDLGPGVDVTRDIDNTATVTTTTTDPVPSNNTDSDNSTVTAKADLSIEKTDSGTTHAGNGLTYTLAVRNDGPSDVPRAVTVTDVLPAGLTFVSAGGSVWNCDYASATRTITCTAVGGLADDTDAPAITVETTVNSDVGASTITNTASVRSDTPEPVGGGKPNSDDDPVTITNRAEISLTKTLSSASPVTAGTDATFTLVAGNAGPSDAAGVTVTDHLPQHMSYVSATGAGWTCGATGRDVVCTRATIAAHATAPDLVITALVSASTPVTLPAGTTTLVNTAGIGSNTPGTSDDPDPVDVPVVAKADLTLHKQAKEPTVVAGRQMTWQLAVKNTGPSDAAGPVTVTDTLPGYQTFVAANAPWTCTADAVPATPAPDAHQSVTCTLATGLADGEDADGLEILTQVDTSAPAGTETNAALATSPTPGTDGEDKASVAVTRTAGLTITKTHTGNGTVDGELAFTLGVHNDGPSLADHVVVTDALPTGLDFVSATGTDWTCAEADRTVTCELAGALASGADAAAITLTTTVRAAAYPLVTNTAVVGSTNPALPETDSASDPVVVEPKATLELTKEHVGTLVVGADAEYRITVRNAGPTPTPGPVVVTDGLPTGLSFVGGDGDGWTCSAEAAVVTCRHTAGLAVDATTVVTLTVRVGAAAYPAVTNAATATAPGAPPASGNDTAPVTPTSVLSISKSVTSMRGKVVTYAIAVTDHGPSDTVEPIVVGDPLPAGLRFRTAGGDGWTCGQSAAAVMCTHPQPLAAGATATFALTADVTAKPGEKIANVAYVGGLGTDATSASRPARITAPRGIDAENDSRGDDGTADTGVPLRNRLALAGLLLLLGLTVLGAARRRRQT